MNPWEVLGAILGWGLVIIVLLIFVVAGLAVIGEFRKQARLIKMRKETYLQEAQALAQKEYQNEVFSTDLTRAFLAGVHWSWGYHRRK